MIFQTEGQFIDMENISDLHQDSGELVRFQCFITIEVPKNGKNNLLFLDLFDQEIAEYISRNLGYYSNVFVTYSKGDRLEPRLLEIHPI